MRVFGNRWLEILTRIDEIINLIYVFGPQFPPLTIPDSYFYAQSLQVLVSIIVTFSSLQSLFNVIKEKLVCFSTRTKMEEATLRLENCVAIVTKPIN